MTTAEQTNVIHGLSTQEAAMYEGCTDLNSYRVAWLETAYRKYLREAFKLFKDVPERYSITVKEAPKTQGKVKHGRRVNECGGGPNIGHPKRDKIGGQVVGWTGLGKGMISIPTHLFPEKKSERNKATVEVLLQLVHDMIHIKHETNNHGKKFRDSALEIGYFGDMAKLKATQEMRKTLGAVAISMPDLPLGRGDGKTPGQYRGSGLKTFICACEDRAPLRSSLKTWAELEKRGLVNQPCLKCNQKLGRDQAEIKKEQESLAAGGRPVAA